MARKIPGNLTFDELQRVMPAGYVPKVKIMLQEILPTGRAGARMRELTHWTSVSVNRNLTAKGKATISLANTNDNYLNNYSMRVFNRQNENQSRIYLKDLYKRVLPYVKEINPRKRVAALRNFQGVRSFDEKQLQSYVEFLYNFDGWNGGLGLENRHDSDFVALGLMQRVTIDAQGQDGYWYALFTGLLSAIEDQYIPGDVPVVNLICSDYWRLFALSEIIVKAGPTPIESNIQFEILKKLGFAAPSEDANVFEGMSGPRILHTVMDITQRTMCWLPYFYGVSGQSVPDSGQVSGTTTLIPQTVPSGVTRNDFFFDDGFWQIPFVDREAIQSNYDGISPLRRYNQAAVTITDSESSIAGESALEVVPVAAQTEGSEPKDGMLVASIASTLLIDKFVDKGVQANVYNDLITSIMAPWQSQRTTAEAIIKRVADTTFYDLYFTGNGDLIYQIPKYNNCPAEYKVSTLFIPPAIIENSTTSTEPGQYEIDIGSAIVETPTNSLTEEEAVAAASTPDQLEAPTVEQLDGIAFYDLADSKNLEGEFDYAPQPEGWAQRFHGFNYVITDLTLRGWKAYSSEEPIVNDVRVPAGLELIKDLGEELNKVSLEGRIPLSLSRDLQRRFGVRVMEAQQIFIPNLWSRPNRQALLDAFAFGLMQQINGRAVSGQVELSFRPDLDLGRNVFIAERQRLYYVQSINVNIKIGSDANTSLVLGFGHDISQEINNPWVTIRDLLREEATPVVTTTGGATAPTSAITLPPAPFLPDPSLGIRTADIPGLAALTAAYEAKQGANRIRLTSVTLTDDGANRGYVNVDPETLRVRAEKKLREIEGNPNRVITLDAYSLARNIESEEASASVVTQVIVAQAAVHRAVKLGVTITQLLVNHTGGPPRKGKYGRQGGRYAATSQDPRTDSLVIAEAVLNGTVGTILSRDSGNYFSPSAQQAIWNAGSDWDEPRKYFPSDPDRLAPVRFDPVNAPNGFRTPKQLVTKWHGSNAWVGDIEGVNTRSFMAFNKEPDPSKRQKALELCIARLDQLGFT